MLKLARLGDGPEIFHTLQGEGTQSGRPSVFVRLSLCNLHCRWCDTDYTWNWEGTPFTHDRDGNPGYQKFKREEHIISLTPEATAAAVAAYPCRRVVLTGGEPLLQQAGLRALCLALREISPDYSFEVETNGTIAPDADLDHFIDQYNVSPKLENSGNARPLRERPEVLAAFVATGKAWFKFVIAGEEDVADVRALEESAAFPKERILLMPEGRTPEAQELARDRVVKLCLEHGYRFTDRLHLRLFGAKRGT